MAVKTFSSGEVLTASDTNTYLNNGGLVYISQTIVTSGVSSTISFNNCFNAGYDNYKLLIDGFQSNTVNTGLLMRLRVGGVDAVATDYYFAEMGLYMNNTSASANLNGGSYGSTTIFNSVNNLALGNASLDIFNPFKTERTYWTGNGMLYNTNFGVRTTGNVHNLSNSYDGFSLTTLGAATIQRIRVRIYGYRNA